MTCLLCEKIAVARRACQRIALAAAADDNAVGIIALSLTLNAEGFSVLQNQCNGGVIDYLHAAVQYIFAQRIDNVYRAFGNGKYPVASLGFQRQAETLEKADRVLGRKSVDRRIQESAVYGNIADKGLDVAVVCDVAAPLAGDHDLPADAPVLFYQCDAGAVFCGCTCGDKSRSTRADDKNLLTYHFSLPFRRGWYKRPRGSIRPRARGRFRIPRPSS